ncbi:MAG: ribose-phosphate diphosphokinase [Patescibacteria group bacterium]|nr:ribose-phosphate diphosphokinase [Patescibacteria group bacterium]
MDKNTNNLALLTGNAHRDLAHEIAACLHKDLLSGEVGRFLDGEAKIVDLGNTRGMDVFIIQPTNQPDRNQTEVELLIDAVERSAERVTAVIPYFGYARQDRRGESRVPISMKVKIRNLVGTGCDRIVFLNLHNPVITTVTEMADNKIKVDHLNARPVILDWIIENKLNKITLSSTDAGGAKLVESFYKRLNEVMDDIRFGIGHKTGSSDEGIDKISLIGDFKDRPIYFIDDMTSSGATIIRAAEAAKSKNAKSINAILIHPVLANLDVCRSLADSPIEKIITTDSLPIFEEAREILGEKLEVISISRLLALAIWHLHHDKSITKLFELEGYLDSLKAMKANLKW